MKEPYPFQKENITAGSRRHVLISDDCGLGKTISAIEIGKAVRAKTMQGVPWRALVVCPKSIRYQWLNSICDQDPGVAVKIVELGEEIGKEATGWHIMHYEAVVRTPPYGLLWDLIVLDEAHRIRNRTRQRTKAVKHLQGLRRVALSGTPMDKDPSELWGILNWLYPAEFTSYWRFRQMYCKMGENSGGYPIVVGPKNVDHLARTLRGRFLKHTKEQVVKDLPPRIMIDVPLVMEREQQLFYDQVRKTKDIEVVTQKGTLVVPSVLAKITRMQQIASFSGSLGPEFSGPSIKVDWTVDFVEDNPKMQIVVFTRFVATANEILQRLQKGGVLAEGFFGTKVGMPHGFLDGSTQVLVATIAKAGEGLDLKHAGAAVFVDQEWSTIKMQQAYDRIHRMGIDAPKMLYILKCSTVDELIADSITKKWNDAQLVYSAIERQLFE